MVDDEGVVDLTRLDEFIDWLEEMTDFGEWDAAVRVEVRAKLIELLVRAAAKE